MIRLLPLPFLLVLSACNNGGDTAKSDTTDSAADSSFEVAQDDRDEDTIIDIHDGEDGADGDGMANADDKDADGDVIRDIIEAGDTDAATLPLDSDGDGVADFLDLDSDNNCIPDETESGKTDGGAVDSDEDGIRDFADDDNDNDNILDIIELDACAGTDTDMDGTADYMDADSDNDGIGDVYEGGTTALNEQPDDSDDDGIPDYRDTDSDNDGLLDASEGGTSGNPKTAPRDTDNDGIADYADTDADGDSLSDADETTLGTDPYDNDTDGDGFSDGGEVTGGTDPLDAGSVIDGLYVEVPERTTVEQEFPFELNIQMGDIGYVVDTTGSMGGTISAINSEFTTIVDDLVSVLSDAGYAAAHHDDYPFGSFGSPSTDQAFYLHQQVTTDSVAMQTALASMTTHSGGDGTEDGFEAIYQASSGAGYDMDCDGNYDASTDVKPFIASAGDPFGGGGGEWYDSTTVGGGTLGGMGFRDYALPIIVEGTDNYMRDPDSSNAYIANAPGGCPMDAGSAATLTSFLDLGAYFMGISINGSLPYPQMVDFANATGSLADLDGDGVAAEPVVQTWSGSSTAFRETIVTGVTQLVAAVKFERVDLQVDGDVYGFVTSIEPEYYEGLGSDDSGTVLNFTLTFRGVVAATTEDQLFKLTLNVLGDQAILLDTLDIIVVVKGTPF